MFVEKLEQKHNTHDQTVTDETDKNSNYEFIQMLLDAEMKAEYIETFIASNSTDPQRTYAYAAFKLPEYFSWIKRGGLEETALAKGMVWFGSLAVYAQHVSPENHGTTHTPPFLRREDWETEEMRENLTKISEALEKFPDITTEEISTIPEDELEQAMIAISYKKTLPFIDILIPSTSE